MVLGKLKTKIQEWKAKREEERRRFQEIYSGLGKYRIPEAAKKRLATEVLAGRISLSEARDVAKSLEQKYSKTKKKALKQSLEPIIEQEAFKMSSGGGGLLGKISGFAAEVSPALEEFTLGGLDLWGEPAPRKTRTSRRRRRKTRRRRKKRR